MPPGVAFMNYIDKEEGTSSWGGGGVGGGVEFIQTKKQMFKFC
jgi:hypothetical protein